MYTTSSEWKNSIFAKRSTLLLRALVRWKNASGVVYKTIFLDYDNASAILDEGFLDVMELDYKAEDINNYYNFAFMNNGNTFADSFCKTEEFGIGQAIMNTFKCQLNNFDGTFDDFDFKGAEIIPYVGMRLPSGTKEWIPKGVYVIDECKRDRIICITANDRMSLTECAFVDAMTMHSVSYPITLKKVVEYIADYCGFTAVLDFNNNDWTIDEELINQTYSCRQIISFIAQLAGGNARFNESGNLSIKSFSTDKTSYIDIPTYKSLNLEENDITVTNVAVQSYYNTDVPASSSADDSITEDNVVPIVENAYSEDGTDGYFMYVNSNPLIPYGKAQDAANAIGDVLIGITFRPMELSTWWDPSMSAGDLFYIEDRDGNGYWSYANDISVSVGSSVNITCGSESATENAASQYSSYQTALADILEATNAKFKNLSVDKLFSHSALIEKLNTDELEFTNTLKSGPLTDGGYSVVINKDGSFSLADGAMTFDGEKLVISGAEMTDEDGVDYSFDDYETAYKRVSSWTTEGTTEINGGMITTNSITASQINTSTLITHTAIMSAVNSDDIHFTNSIFGGTKTDAIAPANAPFYVTTDGFIRIGLPNSSYMMYSSSSGLSIANSSGKTTISGGEIVTDSLFSKEVTVTGKFTFNNDYYYITGNSSKIDIGVNGENSYIELTKSSGINIHSTGTVNIDASSLNLSATSKLTANGSSILTDSDSTVTDHGTYHVAKVGDLYIVTKTDKWTTAQGNTGNINNAIYYSAQKTQTVYKTANFTMSLPIEFSEIYSVDITPFGYYVTVNTGTTAKPVYEDRYYEPLGVRVLTASGSTVTGFYYAYNSYTGVSENAFKYSITIIGKKK